MTFAGIPNGALVFVDANTLLYHFGPHPTLQAPCQALLQRILRQEIVGVTSAHVLSDVAHRMMTIEAMNKLGWPAKGIVSRLRKHSLEIQKLTQFRQVIHDIPRFGLQLLSVAPTLVLQAADLSQQYGLLSGDGLIVATMHDQGIVNLASHDSDFDRVPGITRYAPA